MNRAFITSTLILCGLFMAAAGECESDTTIYDIQTGLVPEDTEVVVKGVVVTTPLARSIAQRFYVQEPAGGAYSGIYVWTNEETEDLNVSPGDVVDITGTYIEYSGLSELYVTDPSKITKVGRVPAPKPMDVLAENIQTQGDQAEAFEGVLVRIKDAVITDANADNPSDFGEFIVDNTLRVDDLFYEPIGDVEPTLGKQYDAITGIMHYSYGETKIEPRYREDYELDPNDPGTIPEYMTVTFIDVGQGDAALFELPTGETILVDGGKEGRGQEYILPVLAQKDITRLDLMVLSHPHSDHCGGLDEVLESVEVLEVWENGESVGTGSYQSFVNARNAEGADILFVAQDFERDYGDVHIKILNSDEDYADENNDSVVFMLSYNHIDFLMTGDIESEEQQDIVFDYGAELQAEVVKVPHHGSSNYHPSFVTASAPEYAVISLDDDNPYGMPGAALVDDYLSVGAQICRTDEVGTIIATTDGLTLDVTCSTTN